MNDEHDPPPPPPPPHDAIAEARAAYIGRVMASLDEALVFDLLIAYRNRLEQAGFDNHLAQMMCVDYHRAVIGGLHQDA